MRTRLQIFESDLNEIKSLSKISQAFVSYISANIDVLRHVINVVDCLNDSRHRKKKKKKKKKKNKKKRKKKTLISRKIRQRATSSERRNSDDQRELKEEENQNRKKKRKKMIKINKKKKKMIWKLMNERIRLNQQKKDDLLDDRRYNKEREFLTLRES